MKSNKKERVSIFFDGSNFYHSAKVLKIEEKINFQKLINELIGARKLINVFYYIAPLDFQTNPNKYWKHQRFLNMLKKIPKFNVVLCTLRKVKKGTGNYRFVIKGDDIHLAIDLVEGACRDWYDTVIIVSGDEDFVPAIKIAQRAGKKVENIYFSTSSSRTLREVCDFSLCLDRIIQKITN